MILTIYVLSKKVTTKIWCKIWVIIIPTSALMRNKCLLMTIFFNLQKPYWSPCPIVQWRILQQLSFSRLLSVFLFFIAMMKMITMTCKLMSKHLSLDKMLVDRDIKASRDSTPLPTSVTTIFTFLFFAENYFSSEITTLQLLLYSPERGAV